MITVARFTKEEWKIYSEQAHSICFGKHKPAEWDRIDFALMAIAQAHPLGYMTCREVDAETLYWQFGGAFPGTKGTASSFRAYEAFFNYCGERYKRVTTLIENDNTAMLRMAMKVGFRVIGTRTFKGQVLLEHLMEF